MLRLSQAFLFSFFVWSIGACTAIDERAYDHTFRMNLAGGLHSLDPAFSKDLSTMWCAQLLYNTLVETDSNLHLKASIAYAWSVDASQLNYTFHLRQDIYFHQHPLFPKHQARKLVAGDVVFSFKRLIDPTLASPGAWIFNDKVTAVNPFEAINDSTFIIHLKQPFQPLLHMLSMPYCSIVPYEVVNYYKEDFRSHPCGTGPFQLISWDEGANLLMHKNPNYWEYENGRRIPYLSGVQLSFFDTKATEFLLFMQHKLDFVNSIDASFKDLVFYKNGLLKPSFQKQFNLQKSTYINTEYIGFLSDTTSSVLKNNPLKKKQYRQAINYAIDRNKIITNFRNGIGVAATKGFIPKGMPGYFEDAQFGYSYQPEKAKQLLAQIGFDKKGNAPPITIYTPDNYADIVNFIAKELKEIGIPVVVEVMQASILKQQMSAGELPMFRAQWIGDYPDAETFLAVFLSSMPAPPNYTRFKNKQFDIWYKQAMQLEGAARLALYRKMDSIMIEEAPVIPLFYDEYVHLYQKKITGLRSNAMNRIDLKRVQKN
jgi:oligopeptide transport system substrate-binding protein